MLPTPQKQANVVNEENRIIPDSQREFVLNNAKSAVMGDRNVQYGDPRADFVCSSKMAQAYFDHAFVQRGYNEIQPQDIAMIQIFVKASRIAWANKPDSWIDIAGYAACGFEADYR